MELVKEIWKNIKYCLIVYLVSFSSTCEWIMPFNSGPNNIPPLFFNSHWLSSNTHSLSFTRFGTFGLLTLLQSPQSLLLPHRHTSSAPLPLSVLSHLLKTHSLSLSLWIVFGSVLGSRPSLWPPQSRLFQFSLTSTPLAHRHCSGWSFFFFLFYFFFFFFFFSV